MTKRRTKTPTPTQQIAFRLPEALLKRLDAAAEALAIQTPGALYSRSDAARVFLTRALDAFEEESEPK